MSNVTTYTWDEENRLIGVIIQTLARKHMPMLAMANGARRTPWTA